MNIRPLGQNVVISLVEDSGTTASGIIVPDAAKDQPERGTVLAVGPGAVLENGQRQEMEVKVGDTVIFKKYAPDEFKIDGEKMSVINASEIIAVIE
ncbi:co-chaperone GroES [Candidatus Uhrbacteria bacterium]|nr:co-chaperone GroES [Candidatus Uhrbacteria bacterium]